MAPVIRLASRGDAESVQAIYAPFCRATGVSFEIEPPSIDEMRKRIIRTLRLFPWLVAVEGQNVVGYAYAGKHRERPGYRWSADVSVYVAEGYRRGGLGRALYTALIEILRVQGYYNALAGVTIPNDGSVGLHRAMGFEPIGTYRRIGFKCGEWHDVLWLQLELRKHESSPAEPIAFPSLRRSRELRVALDLGQSLLDSAKKVIDP
jgi:phosphinothricin acetyltransferase